MKSSNCINNLQISHFGCRRKSPPVGGDFRRQPKCKTCTIRVTFENADLNSVTSQ